MGLLRAAGGARRVWGVTPQRQVAPALPQGWWTEVAQRGFGVFSACSYPCRTPSPLHPPSPLRHLQVFYFALNPDSEDTVCERARSLPRTLDVQTLLGTMGD